MISVNPFLLEDSPPPNEHTNTDTENEENFSFINKA